jgi:hypothetical protein
VGDVRLTLRWRTGCPWNATYREPTAPPYVPAPNLPYNFDYLTDDSGQRVYASDDFSVIGQVEGFGEFVAAP